MSKIILSIIIAVSSVFVSLFSGCKKNEPTAPDVSQIRYDVFYAEDDRFKISVFAEKREDPFIADGNPAPLSPFVSVKVTKKLTRRRSILSPFLRRGNVGYTPKSR